MSGVRNSWKDAGENVLMGMMKNVRVQEEWRVDFR